MKSLPRDWGCEMGEANAATLRRTLEEAGLL